MIIKRLLDQRFVLVLVLVFTLAGAVGSLSACHRATPEAPPQAPKVESVNVEHGGNSTPEPSATFTATPAVPPSPAYPGAYAGTPTPNPTPANLSTGDGLESYVVQSGQTLGWIALVFGCRVEDIVAANHLANADAIKAGQTLVIPVTASETGPALKLVPDSEVVYGPAYIHFDLAGFVAGQAGYLASYAEDVEGRTLTGVEVVQLISQRFSVGPRVLLALLEMQSGWVTQPQPAAETLTYPLGHVRDYYEGLFQQLSWAAVRLNSGYYGWKRGDRTTMRLGDGARIAVAPTLNPGTAGVQNCLAELAQDRDEWLAMVGPEGFPATYARLFGNPFAYAVEPLVPPDLVQPEMRLPWEGGETWYLTGGPHGGWGTGSAQAALDFVPGSKMLGCRPAQEWITAVAAGVVVRSEDGVVILDLDGDGFEQSGWTVLYLHVYADGRVPAGAFVQRGERIGRPSCEGGVAEATHLHLARRYNGEWIPAGSGPLPMVLSGWTAQEDVMPYDGTMVKGEQTRTACECWEDDYNGLVSDNYP
ncbi:MAG TPA: LysM peptidoglycan-binding domain-containing protein [Chloroflexi bacterium]|nr:LysM peptidoglycan-binding domain-containing protein [Chloroflexota bacterium]